MLTAKAASLLEPAFQKLVQSTHDHQISLRFVDVRHRGFIVYLLDDVEAEGPRSKEVVERIGRGFVNADGELVVVIGNETTSYLASLLACVRLR